MFAVSWSHFDIFTVFLLLCLSLSPQSARRTIKRVKEQATAAQVTQQRHLSTITGASVGPQPRR